MDGGDPAYVELPCQHNLMLIKGYNLNHCKIGFSFF